MTPRDEAFWDRLAPAIGPLAPRRRAAAVAYVMVAVRECDLDDTAIDALAEELRQRFSARN